MEQKPRLGIDFGTTYSCVGVWTDGGVVIIPNGIGERTTPSVVIFDSPNEVYVGEETLNHLSKKDSVKIYEIKRLIGKKFNQIKNILRYFPYNVEEDESEDKPIIRMTFDNGETITKTPEEIATLIINKLIQNAESYLNKKVNDIIITVPADFNDTQRNRIKYAAESIKGIKVLQIINEPSAAILSYGFPNNLLKNAFFPFNENYTLIDINKIKKIFHPMEEMDVNSFNNNENPFNFSLKTSFMNQNEDKKVLVFDLGGGTFDVSLIEITDVQFETRATSGDQFLGGGDFDNKLIEYCLDYFSEKNKISKDEIKKNYKSIQKLKIACEETKKVLSQKEEDILFLEDFYEEEPLNCKITKAKFEDLCKDYFNKLLPPIDDVLKDSKIKNTDINEIILVGGSSKIPKIKDMLKEKFPNIPINDSISPDEVVAFGATIYSESLRRSDGEFWEEFEYLDSTPHSYGIELENGKLEIIIPKGCKYPTSVSKYFFNAYDDQYTFIIRVFQGENEYADDNDLLEEFTLYDIPKKKKGELCLQVTFTIDINQILNVTASVAEGNVNKTVQIKRNNLISNENPILDYMNNTGNDLIKQEKQFKVEIMDYCKSFKSMKDDKNKYDVINNYNRTINDYLKFLEEKCKDTESEKYLFLLEKLFKSYSYFFKTQLFSMIKDNQDLIKNIEKNIENYLEKISMKRPFRIRQLLDHFKDIKKDNSQIYYSSSIYSMELLQKKADDYFNKNQKNLLKVAKNIYEESLLIGKKCINDDITLNTINNDLKRRYNEVIEKCKNKIKIISVDSYSEIENTRITGNLFSNDNNLDNDDLSLLSFNLEQYLKKLNEIQNLKENNAALESKSICLANIVKIEFLFIKKTSSLQKLLDYAEESINIANNLGDNYKNKNWYKEINDLKNSISEKIVDSFPAPPIENIQKLRSEFAEKIQYGNEEFLRHLLTKYPYEGCQFSEEMIQEYLLDKRKYLKKLKMKYKNKNNDIMPQINSESNEKNNIILEFINNMLNKPD